MHLRILIQSRALDNHFWVGNRFWVMLVAMLFFSTSGAVLTSCTKKVDDARRDAMVDSKKRVTPVIIKALKVDPARVLPIATLAELGLTNPMSDEAKDLRTRFQAEFGKELPENLIDQQTKVGDIIRYVAESVYNVDLNEQRQDEVESTLLSPEARKEMKAEEEKEIEEGDDPEAAPVETATPEDPDKSKTTATEKKNSSDSKAKSAD